MTIIVDITVPADRFELGHLFREFPEIEVELERVVPLQEAIIPLFWISGAETADVEVIFREHPQIRDVDVLTTAHDATLFEVRWSSDLNGFVQTLIETQAKILEASGNAQTWDFRLRFPSHEMLAVFNQEVTGDGIPVTLRHLYNPMGIDERYSTLTPEQRDALVRAYHRGYFEIPRNAVLTEIAEEMGISDSALSQRLRRGTAALIEQALIS